MLGYQEYLKRLRAHCKIELRPISAEKRNAHSNLQQLIEREGEKIIAASKREHVMVALEVTGSQWSTEAFATKLRNWQDQGRSVDFIIGGAFGLSENCLNSADEKWSLSHLTFPHAFVPVLILEQLYRSFCILTQHPYHH